MEMKDLIYAAAYVKSITLQFGSGYDGEDADKHARRWASMITSLYESGRQKEKDPGNEGF